MFFDEEELKVAEDLAWKVLDGRNHVYMPDLKDYAHFYYKGQIIFDPWMNEKSQRLPWPDHESKDAAVNPVEYYGQNTIENYIVNLFMLRPEWAPEITEMIKRHLGDNGRLLKKQALCQLRFILLCQMNKLRKKTDQLVLNGKYLILREYILIC